MVKSKMTPPPFMFFLLQVSTYRHIVLKIEIKIKEQLYMNSKKYRYLHSINKIYLLCQNPSVLGQNVQNLSKYLIARQN